MLTAFHWVVGACLLLILGALLLARRAAAPVEERKPFRCSICGDGYDEEELVEREFTSGYSHAICGKCTAALYDDAQRRGLIDGDLERDARA